MSDSELPDSPLTDLAQGAAQLHEMYASYMDAGFPEGRAFELVRMTLGHFLDSD
jgi:hypothetical protein